MKNVLMITVIMLLWACSSSQPIPQWKDTASRQLENYRVSFLTGEEDDTEPHLAKAKKAISSSNDLNTLAMLYLTKYALHVAALEDFDDNEFIKIDKLQPNDVHRAYYNFLKGHFAVIDADSLPSQYGKFLLTMVNHDYLAANHAIASIEDPLSRLIACGLRIKYAPPDEITLQLAIDTAAKEGWRRPLWAYLTRLQKYYLENQATDKANIIKERLDILNR